MIRAAAFCLKGLPKGVLEVVLEGVLEGELEGVLEGLPGAHFFSFSD